jgi:hypothetical protein
MRLPPGVRLLAAIGLGVLCARAAGAQQRPLTIEDPEVIGAGRVLVEAGVESGRNARYFLSGLEGDRVAMPMGVSVGLGNIAELQLDAGYTWFDIDSRTDGPLAYRVPVDATRTSDVIDLTVATKIHVCGEGTHRPAFAVRFATRLPNASNESGPRTGHHGLLLQHPRREDIRAMARHGQRRPRHPEQIRWLPRSRTTPSWAAWRWRVR